MRRGVLLLFSMACGRPPAPPPITVQPASAMSAPKPVVEAKPVVEETAGPDAPPFHAYEPGLAVDGGGLFNAASSKEIWLWFGDFTVIVDRTTGCATESYPDELHALVQRGLGEEELAKPETLKAIRHAVGLGRRLGVQRTPYDDHLAWSADGRYVFFESQDRLYRSTNGARSFSLVDDERTGRLTMNGQGTRLVYERGNDYYVFPIDANQPKPLTAGQTFYMRADGPANMLFWRTESKEECLDTFDTTTTKRLSAHCIPYPSTVVGGWNTREWLSVSPKGRYGLVKWEITSPGLTYVVSLVDLTTDKVVKTLRDHVGDVDDEGNMVMSSVQEGGGDHTYLYPFNGARRLIGNHALLAYQDHTAILGVSRKANLGARKCDLVKLVKIP